MAKRPKRRSLPPPGPRLIGYARKMDVTPRLRTQINALRRAGVHHDNLWKDRAGETSQRDLASMDARQGDVLVVAKLQCLSPRKKTLASILVDLPKRGVHFWSLYEGLDTRASSGELVIPGLLAVMENNSRLHSEAIRYGLARAREKGRIGGRRRVLSAEDLQTAEEMIANKQPLEEIAVQLGVCRATLYNSGLGKRKSRPRGAASGSVAG